MDIKEMRQSTTPELEQELAALLKTQFGLRMQKATQQLKNTSQLKKVRRDIARARTVLRQKNVEGRTDHG